jgi:hypothetical protein
MPEPPRQPEASISKVRAPFRRCGGRGSASGRTASHDDDVKGIVTGNIKCEMGDHRFLSCSESWISILTTGFIHEGFHE